MWGEALLDDPKLGSDWRVERRNPWTVPSPLSTHPCAGARFSKVPRTFGARKAIRKTTTCLFCKAGLLIRCKGNRNKNNCKVSCLETPSFWRYKENYVTRNTPEKFRDFRETGPRASGSGRQLAYRGSWVDRREANKSILHPLRKGKIVWGSNFHSLKSLNTLDFESAMVFNLPCTCWADIMMFLSWHHCQSAKVSAKRQGEWVPLLPHHICRK